MTYTETVGQLVAERPSRARVFERFGIDYCCGGKKPLVQACQEKGVALERVVGELEQAESPSPAQPDPAKMTMTQLVDHIEATHHLFLRDELPRMDAILHKVATVHGANHPEMVDVYGVFSAMKEELESHMMKEEQILFPMIRQLEDPRGERAFHCGSIQNPIRVMFMEHDNAGAALQKMRELTHDYAVPADVCNTYRAALDALATLEADMHQHVHKENNILFPKAVEAEAQR